MATDWKNWGSIPSMARPLTRSMKLNAWMFTFILPYVLMVSRLHSRTTLPFLCTSYYRTQILCAALKPKDVTIAHTEIRSQNLCTRDMWKQFNLSDISISRGSGAVARILPTPVEAMTDTKMSTCVPRLSVTHTTDGCEGRNGSNRKY